MFIDYQTSHVIYANLNESVIHGTHRNCDLIPAFLDVLKDTPEHLQAIGAIPDGIIEDENSEWWESLEAIFMVEALFDALDKYAPEGYCFGSHPGDGSDFGFWKVEDFNEG